MTRYIPLFLLLGACTTDGGSDSAIEITGYLDSGRISVTSILSTSADEVDHSVVGEAGAADPGLEVTALNARTGTEDIFTAAEDGSFALSVPALHGDVLSITQGDVDAVEFTSQELPLFPELMNPAQVGAPDADGVVPVVLDFTEPQGELAYVMHILHGDVAELSVNPDLQHQVNGHINAASGDSILIHGLDAVYEPTHSLEVVVP